MLHLKRLEDVKESDFADLVTNRIREGQHIDYKVDINLTAPKAKPELLRDISSFANASGGDYVVGVEEKDGEASKVAGITSRDFEGLEQQSLQICRAHLDPPVTEIRFRTVQLDSGAYVFIVRILKTWNGPHMIMMDHENRCWTRDQSGKRVMDIPDLKQVMAFSEGAAERMKNFRMERVGNVIARETPIPLRSARCFVLHIFPLAAFTTSLEVDLSKDVLSEFALMRHVSGYSPGFAFEGRINYTAAHQQQPHTYVLLFRNGVIECVESSGLEPMADTRFKGAKLFFPWHFALIHRALDDAGNVYRKLALPGPFFICLTLTDVKSYHMFVDPQHDWGNNMSINRDILALPETLIDTFDVPAENTLEPIFKVWFQACGYSEMPQWFRNEIKRTAC